MTDDDPLELGDVLDYPDDQRDDTKRWLVLFDEDYHNVGIDPEDNVALLLDLDQAKEVFELTSNILADLTWQDVDDDQPIRDLILELEAMLDDD